MIIYLYARIPVCRIIFGKACHLEFAARLHYMYISLSIDHAAQIHSTYERSMYLQFYDETREDLG
jgi:hypothetical protein